MKQVIYSIGVFLSLCSVNSQENPPKVQQWHTHEIVLQSTANYTNPYTDVDVWAVFTNQHGDSLLRPAFWDGNTTWKIRFAPTDFNSVWSWESFSSNVEDTGLHQQGGSLKSIKNRAENELLKNGPLKMSPGHRNIIHHSGKSFLMIGGTPWAMPFRATLEQVKTYAKDRQEKGFNTALMMTVQPDMKAEGPNERNTEQGFKRGFNDLADGHLNELNVDYFQYYDKIVAMLLEHGIVPVYQPVFHGYGWKGLATLGRTVVPEEYVRYCKYLLARYGSRPSIWLLGADHNGKTGGIRESGEMLQQWDAYAQPTGLHYNPCDDYLATWAKEDSDHCFHNNNSYQNADWLDFQWAQSGHDGEHLYHKVERMYHNLPTKAVANGEPTYEGMQEGKNGLGWWQGEEAWMQLMHGGTMGVVYGAATLWQWKISPTEQGWPAWTDQQSSWHEALQMQGSTYVGMLGTILKYVDLTDIEKRWDLAHGKPLLAQEGELYISYLNDGGTIEIKNLPKHLSYKWISPKNGKVAHTGRVETTILQAPNRNPWVLIVY